MILVLHAGVLIWMFESSVHVHFCLGSVTICRSCRFSSLSSDVYPDFSLLGFDNSQCLLFWFLGFLWEHCRNLSSILFSIHLFYWVWFEPWNYWCPNISHTKCLTHICLKYFTIFLCWLGRFNCWLVLLFQDFVQQVWQLEKADLLTKIPMVGIFVNKWLECCALFRA